MKRRFDMNFKSQIALAIMGVLALIVIIGIHGPHTAAKTRPSYLIVAVDGLSESNLSCDPQAVKNVSHLPGVRLLCQQSEWFRHAFTPSPMSVAGLASILTGLYPIENGVHDPGDYLRAKFETAAELAYARHYATSFWSGGPAVLRKSGLNQGFEFFDDILPLRNSRPERSSRTEFTEFLHWLNNRADSAPFFTIIYVPRPRQMLEFRQNLSRFILALKKLDRWRDTTFILTGLNGEATKHHPNELSGTDLYSENTKIALLIKPAVSFISKSAEPEAKSVDMNVSLVDLGFTLRELLTPQTQPVAKFRNDFALNQELNRFSLATFFNRLPPKIGPNRLILLESSWAHWHGLGSIRYGVRNGPYLLLDDDQLQIYDTRSDPREEHPLSDLAPVSDLVARSAQLFFNHRISEWHPLKPTDLSWMKAARLILNDKYLSINNSRFLKILIRRNRQVAGWIARRAIQAHHWHALLKLADLSGRSSWRSVALANLHKPFTPLRGSCFHFINKSYGFIVSHFRNQCRDGTFEELLLWLHAPNHPQRALARSKFLNLYFNDLLKSRLASLNYVGGLMWDLPMTEPEGPNHSDLLLAMPALESYQRAVIHFIRSEDR